MKVLIATYEFSLIRLLRSKLGHVVQGIGTGAALSGTVALLSDLAHLARVERRLGVLVDQVDAARCDLLAQNILSLWVA